MVKNTRGELLGNFLVKITDANEQIIHAPYTRSNGYFSIRLDNPGNYGVIIDGDQNGCENFSQSFTIASGQRYWIDIVLNCP
ncbi:MAG: carboxypeptidase-like regulatory domain-containing protein [Candidatus Wildermuthbacteria bacterium]|nr:carboxypeptidase-like regulatory domain-containing protein [Candidatus Wildermuthbacteria bacterium]